MSDLIVVKKSILEDVQDGLLNVFNQVADDLREDKTRLAPLAKQILEYEQEICTQTGRPINQANLTGVQAKLLTAIKGSSFDEGLIELSAQILAYEKVLGKPDKAASKLSLGGPG